MARYSVNCEVVEEQVDVQTKVADYSGRVPGVVKALYASCESVNT